MNVLARMDAYGHERIVFGRDEATGLRAIIAIHDTTLGPAVGGTRFLDYASEEDALYDVLRLSRGMSLKNAAAGLPLGGGKAVLIGDPKKLKGREFFHAYGRMVNALGGTYYTAEDVNTNTRDIEQIREVTPYVTGTPDISGNPSPFTARGVFQGMRAGAKARFGADSFTGLSVAVQGVGTVGYALCEMLHEAGATLSVGDVNPDAVRRAVDAFGARAVDTNEILAADCDVFAPCALGAVISAENAAKLRCRMVCGAANNVLVNAEAGDELMARDILYLPDFIVNAGGIINCAVEITEDRYDAAVVLAKVDGIYDTALRILAMAKELGVSPHEAAERYAMEIIRAGRVSK